MPNHELVTASNLRKSSNCFELSIFFFFLNGIFTESPWIGSNLFHDISIRFLFLKQAPERAWLIHDLCFLFLFLFVWFEKEIDPFFFYGFFSHRDVWIHGSMCLYGSCSWINENVPKFDLPLPFYESLPFCVSHRHALWQHLLIRNLICKPYFDPNVFGMLLITNEWQVMLLL